MSLERPSGVGEGTKLERAFSGVAGRIPIAPRLALRDLARYQARSGAALAAITLALGIAAAVVVTALAEENRAADDPPNLTTQQVRVYKGPTEAPELISIQTNAQVALMAARVRQLAAGLDHATVIPLRNAYQPGAPAMVIDGDPVLPTISLSRTPRHRPRAVLVHHPQRSSPARLEADPGRLAHRVEPAADERADRRRAQARSEFRPDDPSPPRQPLTREADRHRNRRRRAPGARDPRHDRRADPQRERRRPSHLTATGATSRTRRSLTGATAGALALLGALLGVAGAYLVLGATYFDDLGYLSGVPVLSLVLIVVGVQLTATAAGWLLAGREPPAIARPAIE
jgi:hypothetical protein